MSDDLPPQPPLPPWEQQPAKPSRPDPHGPRDDVDQTPGVRAKPKQTILRSGPNSFSLGGRLIGTAILSGIGFGLYWLAGSIGVNLGSSGMALVMFLVGLYVVIAGLLLWALWRPARVDDPTARPQMPPPGHGEPHAPPTDPNARPQPPGGPQAR